MFVRPSTRIADLLMLLVALAACALPAAADDKNKQKGEDPEVKLGRESAAENDKNSKFVTDAAVVDRVNRIGQEIAAVANSVDVPAIWGTPNVKKFAYTFKVINDKDVNAFSLPGGFIYVCKGLLDYVHSDDELAGVLAHEITHAAHHHMVKLIHEQNKLQTAMIPALLVAALVGSKSSNAYGNGNGAATTAGSALIAMQLYTQAKLNTYGIEAEKDADHGAIYYLTKTRYNPVGLLTFMERLASEEQRGPQPVLGIYRTHPPSPERAKAALAELEALKIAVNRREVDPMIRATTTMTAVNGTSVAEVKMYKTVVARMAAADGMTAEQRGKRLADTLNHLFDQGLQMFEVRLSADRASIVARYQTILSFTSADAEAQSHTPQELAEGALTAIKSLLWQDQLNRPSAAVGDSGR